MAVIKPARVHMFMGSKIILKTLVIQCHVQVYMVSKIRFAPSLFYNHLDHTVGPSV